MASGIALSEGEEKGRCMGMTPQLRVSLRTTSGRGANAKMGESAGR